jgi:arginase
MKIRIIQVPYDSGRRGKRTGRGPLQFLENKADDLLRANGWNVEVEAVESQESFTAEIATAFELARLLAERVRAAREGGAFPLILAGNCISSLGTISGSDPGRLGLVWFDAHGDLNTPETTPSGYLDGMALATALGRGWPNLTQSIPSFVPIPEDRVVMVGIRQLDPPEAEFLAQSPITLVNPTQLRESGVARALAAPLSQLRGQVSRVYIHLDLDVLDPLAAGQANMYAEPDGLTLPNLEEALSLISQQFEIEAIAFTAYDPSFDADQRVFRVGVRLMEHVCRLVEQSSERKR